MDTGVAATVMMVTKKVAVATATGAVTRPAPTREAAVMSTARTTKAAAMAGKAITKAVAMGMEKATMRAAAAATAGAAW